MKNYFYYFILLVLFSVNLQAKIKNTRTGNIYNKIYLAVWDAEQGDTLLIAHGIYTNDWIPLDHLSLTVKGNYSDDFSVQYAGADTVILAGQKYAAWLNSCTSYLEYVQLTAGEHGLIAQDSIVTCNNVFVEYNTNNTMGAGILAYENSRVVMSDSHVWNNYSLSSGLGGGAYISNNCDLILGMHCNFLGNEAYDGGGIYASGANIDLIFSTSIYGNKAENNGGGIYVDSSVLNVRKFCSIGADNAIITNQAIQYGGGIYANNSTVIFTNEATLAKCSSEFSGGGIYAKESKVYFYDSLVTNNNAGSNGGGIYMYGGEVIIKNTELNFNSAGGAGGAIRCYNGASAKITDSRLQNNFATNDGGAFAAYNATGMFLRTDCLFNRAGDDGGAIYLSDSFFTIEKFKINNNYADVIGGSKGYGGGICLFNTTAKLINGNFGSVILTNSAENGGGIYAGNHSKVSVAKSSGGIITDYDDLEIVFNAASVHGGGICLNGSSSIVSTGRVLIASNSAQKGGGGVYVSDRSYLKLVNFSLFNKTEIKENGSFENGGGIFLTNKSEFVGIDCIIDGNLSLNDGGGVYAHSSTATVHAISHTYKFLFPPCSISENFANRYGGAAFLFNSYFYLDEASVTNNSASGLAGAIDAINSRANIINVLIAGNKAPTCGGIVSALASHLCLSYCTVADNSTNVFLTGTFPGTVYLTNCIVYGNFGEITDSTGTTRIVYSDVQGGYVGVGNINADPEFDARYMLSESSPCIGAAADIGINYDAIGETRPYGGSFDMGCYEFVPEPCLFIIYYLLFIIYHLLSEQKI